jgi:hypothetical protein
MSPAFKITCPPIVPVVPDPTAKEISPPAPEREFPLEMINEPDVPVVATPVNKFKFPLTPLLPAFAVCI